MGVWESLLNDWIPLRTRLTFVGLLMHVSVHWVVTILPLIPSLFLNSVSFHSKTVPYLLYFCQNTVPVCLGTEDTVSDQAPQNSAPC